MALQQTLEIQFEKPKENTEYSESNLKLGHLKENAKKNCTSQKNFVSLQPLCITKKLDVG
ncbi:MAG: hypothetical protein MJZ79_08285 [Paludibacteraceae bacterium]|nr:hypothetical protein [Paludibacteraceae bacterium]